MKDIPCVKCGYIVNIHSLNRVEGRTFWVIDGKIKVLCWHCLSVTDKVELMNLMKNGKEILCEH